MKRKLLFVLTAIIAVGLLITGCPDNGGGGGDNNPPNYGTNLVTEEAILAATGKGVTKVEKVSGGYEVTGTVTHHEPWWDGSNPPVKPEDWRIQLNIQADPDDATAYFALADRYIVTIDFPNSAVKPIDTYDEGFQIYLENEKATENTVAWAGTWKHSWPDEYNKIGGVGKMTINRSLKQDPKVPGSESEVGDYQHLVLVLKFDEADEGGEYKFTISKAEVYGKEVSDVYLPEKPRIHDTAQLADATYAVGATAATLGLVGDGNEHALVVWTANSANYVFKWYVNTTNSTTGGNEVTDESLFNWNKAGFTPPTTTAGIFYYYVVISFTDTEMGTTNYTTSRAVKITVTN